MEPDANKEPLFLRVYETKKHKIYHTYSESPITITLKGEQLKNSI